MRKILLNLLFVAVHATEDQVYYPAASYSSDRVRALFQGVEFSDPDVSIIEVQEYRKRGVMVLEFGEVTQLEDSLDRKIQISASKLYFSHVPGRKDISYGDDVVTMIAYKVVGNDGLKARGRVGDLGQSMIYFPKKIDFSRVFGQFGGLSTDGEVLSRKRIVRFFYDVKREDVIVRRTEDAEALALQNKQMIEGMENQDHQADFNEAYPGYFVHSDSPITYLMSQVIGSIDEQIIVAPSVEELKEFKRRLKFDSHLKLLLPDHQCGVYSGKPLTLKACVSIKSDSDLLVLGGFYNRYSILKLRSKLNLFVVGSSHTGGTSFRSGKSQYIYGLFDGIEFRCYDLMSLRLFSEFVAYLEYVDFITEGWKNYCIAAKTRGDKVDSLKMLKLIFNLGC